MILLLFFLGALGGFLSGLLGIGGAIIMIPLLLSVPPALAVGQLDARVVSGLSMVQVFFSSLSGIYRYRKYNLIHARLLAAMGTGMLGGATVGSILSNSFENQVILVVFGVLALSAAVMMLFPAAKADDPGAGEGELRFNPVLAFALALVVGFLSSIVGAGGGFIVIPLMLYVLKIPIRTAIGTSIAVVFLGALFGVIGKGITGQVRWDFALPLILSSIPFAQLGGMVSKRVSPKVLHNLLFLVILATCVQMWVNILGS